MTDRYETWQLQVVFPSGTGSDKFSSHFKSHRGFTIIATPGSHFVTIYSQWGLNQSFDPMQVASEFGASSMQFTWATE